MPPPLIRQNSTACTAANTFGSSSRFVREGNFKKEITMKKSAKLLVSLTLTASLALSGILAACTDPENPDDPCTEHVDANGDGVCDNCGETVSTPEPAEKQLYDGRWITPANTPDGEGATLKLKEDGSYYYYSAWTYSMGNWEVVEGNYTYYKIEVGNAPDASAGDDTTAYEATEQLVLTAFDGASFKGVIAEGRIWNMERSTLQGTSWNSLAQEADYVWDEDRDEEPIASLELCETKDASAQLIFYASMTNEGALFDSINGNNITADSGSYEKSVSGDVTTYTLKNGGTAYATLTVNADGTYTYTPDGEEGFALVTEAWTTTQLLTSGDEYISLSFGGAAEDAMAELRLWQDNSADVVVTRIKDYSYETVLSGTYTQNGDRTMTLTFGEESYTVSAPDENKLISVALTIPAGEYVTEAAEITLTGEVKEVGTPLFSFASGTVTFGTTGASPTPTMDGSLELVLYSDGIAEMNVTVSPAAGMEFTTVLDSGTYTVDESGTVPVYTFNFEKAGALTSSVAEGATETAATLELSYSVENASGTFDMGVPAVINFTVEDALLTYDWSAEAVYTFTATGIEVTAASPLPSQEGNTVDVTLSLWADGTATLDLVLHTAGSADFSAPASETGTWTADTSGMIPTITVTMASAGTLTSAPDYSSATQTGIDLTLTYTAEGISYMTTMGIPVSLTFTGTLTGHYSIG